MTLKHGDVQDDFATGAKRDSQLNKPRPDLISPIFLDRLGKLMAEGAAHYGERNWEKGMPLSRLQASAMRHMIQFLAGQADEDHAIQCAFNLMAFVHTLQKIEDGKLPAELDDLKSLSRKESPTVGPSLCAHCGMERYNIPPDDHPNLCRVCWKESLSRKEELVPPEELVRFPGCNFSTSDHRTEFCPACGGSIFAGICVGGVARA